MGACAFPFPTCAAPLPAFAEAAGASEVVAAGRGAGGGAGAGLGAGGGGGGGGGGAGGGGGTPGAVRSVATGTAARGSGVGDSENVVSVIVWLCRSHWPEAYGEISPYE